MCYDISFSAGVELITDYLPDIVIHPQVGFDFDTEHLHLQAQVFSKAPVIVWEEGRYKQKIFEWGVIADYMDTPEKIQQGRKFMCNAQGEKIIGDKRSYWHQIRHTRCLVPVTGIFEHREVKGFKHKIPYYIRVKERAMFCLPGLYHYPLRANPGTGEITGTFTIVTRAANAIMRQIHNCGENAYRMPLFLSKELELKWLLPELTDREIAEIISYEMPSEELEYHPVYTIRTSKLRPDGKEKTAPYSWQNLPPLGVDSIVQELF